jgi:hypothetical protein
VPPRPRSEARSVRHCTGARLPDPAILVTEYPLSALKNGQGSACKRAVHGIRPGAFLPKLLGSEPVSHRQVHGCLGSRGPREEMSQQVQTPGLRRCAGKRWAGWTAGRTQSWLLLARPLLFGVEAAAPGPVRPGSTEFSRQKISSRRQLWTYQDFRIVNWLSEGCKIVPVRELPQSAIECLPQRP